MVAHRLYTSVTVYRSNRVISVNSLAILTVKPFNLAAVKVGDFACKIILAPFILVN